MIMALNQIVILLVLISHTKSEKSRFQTPAKPNPKPNSKPNPKPNPKSNSKPNPKPNPMPNPEPNPDPDQCECLSKAEVIDLKKVKDKCLSKAEIIEIIESKIESPKLGSTELIESTELIDCPENNHLFRIVDGICMR